MFNVVRAESTIVSDGAAEPWARRPTDLVVMDVWRVDQLPASVSAGASSIDELGLNPAAQGVPIRTAVFPLDSASQEIALRPALAALGDTYGTEGNSTVSADEVRALHQTETVDALTVVDGRAVGGHGGWETLLRAGDTMVQRGTRHAWSNRPATVVTTMLTALH